MKIQPRQQLLEVWSAAARLSYQADPQGKGKKRWVTSGRDGSNSISDAEQLLVFVLPASEIPSFGIHHPDHTNSDVAQALAGLGEVNDIPRILLNQISEYFKKYTRQDGTPDFSGGSYLNSTDPAVPPSEAQLAFDVVESYAASITLCLSTLTLVRGYREAIRDRRDIHRNLDALQGAASRRLTAALVGLLRSFTVNVFRLHERNGVELMRTVNQSGAPEDRVVAELRDELADVRAGLRRITIGSGQVREDESELQETSSLFELGWSWGVIKNAPLITILDDFKPTPDIGVQAVGYAYDAPYLYFTVVALDALAELFTDRTRQFGLLDDPQQRLADALRIRYDLTQQYWATIASYGEGPRWPLEDIPWRSVDGEESDYFTLMVSSISARQISRQSENLVGDLTKMVRVMAELANRGRITRRPIEHDPALELHAPGYKVLLELSEEVGGPQLNWVATDFAALLLKRCIRTSALISDIATRGRMINVVDQVWDHVRARRLKEGPGRGLWDQPNNIYKNLDVKHEAASWHHTLRIVEALVQAAELVRVHPVRSEALLQTARELLHEAEHLYDQELLAVDQALLTSTADTSGPDGHGSSLRGEFHTLADKLDRARDILEDRPGTATALFNDVLVQLDRLARIRQRVAAQAGAKPQP